MIGVKSNLIWFYSSNYHLRLELWKKMHFLRLHSIERAWLAGCCCCPHLRLLLLKKLCWDTRIDALWGSGLSIANFCHFSYRPLIDIMGIVQLEQKERERERAPERDLICLQICLSCHWSISGATNLYETKVHFVEICGWCVVPKF